MSDKPLNILLIEDNAGDARLIGEMLSEAKRPQFDLECVDRLSTGLSRLAAGGIDVVLLDLSLPDSQGFETYVKLHGQDSGVPILVLTGLADETIAIRAMQEGAQDYLIKGDVTGSMLARAIHYAIERKRAEQAQHFLAAASSVLATSLDYETTLDRVACLAVPDRADWCAVHILEADGTIRRLALAHVDPARAAIARERPSRYPLDPNAQHLVPKVIRTSRSELYSEVPDSLLIASARDAEHLKTLRLLGFKSYICVPLMAQGRSFGAITVAMSEAGRRHDERDLALIEELASRAAIAIDNARLYRAAQEEIAERKRAEEALQRYTERLKHLREIDQSILSSRSLAEIAQAAVLHISHLIPSTLVALVLIDMAAQTVTLFALQVSGEICVPPGLQAPIQIIGEALEPLKQGQVYQVTDVAALPELPPWLRVAQVEHVQAYFYMPILDDTELIAMLNVGSDQPGAFSVEYVDIAREVANQLSIALQQARLHEQIQRHARELEQGVIARTAELEAANKELEAFSYSVSHDLRAPLRAIDGFSRILLEDYIADLPDEAQRYLQLVAENTQQMGHLIDDLLTFARLSRQPLNKRWVATADLARQCLEDLHAEQAGRCVEISIGDMPACQGDPALLNQVWINLIANALKYTRRRDLAVIEIGCQEGGEVIYYVKDNGVGFDMRYINKLFGVFQRMHRAEDYEGTGVGLAIVQRVVHRHGGRVWAEAEVDRGATFYFTLGGGTA
jgi:signal transduction histidine kinase/DNA-binding NarL/FixJ family response regulator